MNNNSNKIQKRKMSIDRTVNVHVSYEGLMSYLQMYSTGVCYVLFRWDMAWGEKTVLVSGCFGAR